MVMFGARKKKGFGFPWDQEDNYNTPPIYDPTESTPQDTTDKPKKTGFWGGGDKFSLSDGIAAALATIGDAFAAQNGQQGQAIGMLTGGRMDARRRAEKDREEAAKAQQTYQIAVANGATPAQAQAIVAGMYNLKDLQPGEDPAAVKVADWYMTATPEQRQAYDMTNPIVTNGYGSQYVPRSTMQQGNQQQTGATAPGTIEDGYQFMGGDDADPNNWKKVGGGVGNGTHNFR